MYTLGINGWISDVHDSSACLFKDNKLLGAVEEERFIRKKHAFDTIPWLSIDYLLKMENITPDNIDNVVFGWNIKELYKKRFNKIITDEKILMMIFKNYDLTLPLKTKVVTVNHHLSHAAGAYFSSGFRNSNVLVVDGSGENESISEYYVTEGKWNFIKSFPIMNSVGTMYEALTEFLGFSNFSEGKVMGLSAYGKLKYDIISPLEIKYDDKKLNSFNKYNYSKANWKKIFKEVTGMDEIKNKINFDYSCMKQNYNNIDQKYLDLVTSVQKSLEKSVIFLINKLVKETKNNNICFSGGTSLNVLLNNLILKMNNISNFFVQPYSSDSGVSIGACLYLLNKMGYKATVNDKEIYSGPKWSNYQIENILTSRKINFKKFSSRHEMNLEISKILSLNDVVAVLRGRMEFGPRALGNRSILASPKKKNTKDKINKIKNREYWRPFALSILKEKSDEILNTFNFYSPFMNMNYEIKKGKEQFIPAVVHEDLTTRSQIITEEFNPEFYDLINEFNNLTDIPAVLNTSFNVGNEPIVCSPVDALRTFYSSGIDCLVLENYLIRK